FINNKYPNVSLIESKQNLGFAQGNNLGVSRSMGEYILLLNNDTLLLSSITPVLSIAEKNSKIGLIGIKMIGVNNEYRYSTGHYPNLIRLLKFSLLYRKDGYFQKGNFPQDENKYYCTDWIEGSWMLTKRKIWDELGGMDKDYFMYVEDVDLCWRIKKLKYKIVFYPYASYLHYGGYGESRFHLLIAGFLKFHRKHSSNFYQLLLKIVLLIGITGRLSMNTLLSLRCKESFKKNLPYIVSIKEVFK
ncbi:MAG: glycosyltransferase family 2 protein, partial [Proteobacteria bacterium]|nr:glycosyltransferase family 2 protein [Pseudomonadota bacterium]